MAWTCQRVARGVRCAALNPNRKRNCQKCGKPRPARRRPTHLVALELSYEDYVRLNELELRHQGFVITTDQTGGYATYRLRPGVLSAEDAAQSAGDAT